MNAELDPMLLVSADGHWGAPIADYVDYIDPEYRDDMLALVPLDENWRSTSLSQRRFSDETLDLIDGDSRVRAAATRDRGTCSVASRSSIRKGLPAS